MNENIKELVTKIEHLVEDQYYNTYDTQNEIIQFLNNLEIEPNEEYLDSFSESFEKLVKETKYKINEYVEKTKEYEKNQKLFEEKLAESEQKRGSTGKSKKIRKEEQDLFTYLIDNANHFVDNLKICETLFTDHLQFLRFGNEK